MTSATAMKALSPGGSSERLLGLTALPVLDAEMVTELCRLAPLCEPDFLNSLVTQFDVSARQSLDTLRAAMLSRDSEAIENAAHRLRGASGSVGAVRVSVAAGVIEETPFTTEATNDLEMLRTAVNEAVAALHRQFGGAVDPPLRSDPLPTPRSRLIPCPSVWPESCV